MDRLEIHVTKTASDTWHNAYLLNEAGTLRIANLGWWSERDGEGAVHDGPDSDDNVRYVASFKEWEDGIRNLLKELSR